MSLTNCTPVLFVKDAKKAQSFYEKILGFKVKADFGGENIIFEEGFTLWQISDQDRISQTLGMGNIINPAIASRFELCFETDELDTIYQTLKENDVKFLNEIHVELWGQRNIRFYDYDGHLIEVGEAMHIFLRRIYNEENQNLEATSKRTFVAEDMLKEILEL